jgi:muramoyltetrapeptide carboxypeptidase
MSLLLPPPLAPGDAIGFFSPSSAVTTWAPRRFARATAYLEARGFRLVPGSLTGRADHYRSGSIEARAEEFNALVRDPQIRCVMSTIGGMNSNAMLPHLDYEALVADPKIIVGYSDVTALLLGIHARTGLVTFQGPALVASFGEFPPLVDETFASFAAMTMGPPRDRHVYDVPAAWTDERIDWETQDRAKSTRPNDCRFHRGRGGDGPGRVRGRLIGGNLNTIGGIWGSPFMPEIRDGDVLLIEDSLKDIATVERSFAFLDLNGVFDRVGAILLGKHELFDDRGTGRTPHDVLREVLGDRDPPMVIGFDSCHTHPMLTVPIGVMAEIDFGGGRGHGQVSLVEPWLAG